MVGLAGIGDRDGPADSTVAPGRPGRTLVTLVAALGPARRAARTAPVEAMRRFDPAPGRPRRARRITGLVLSGLGAGQLLAAALRRDVAGLAAGLLPARRGARLDVLTAIAAR